MSITKVLTSILSTRLNKFISNYTHADQTGFIPQRQLRDYIKIKQYHLICTGAKHTTPIILS